MRTRSKTNPKVMIRGGKAVQSTLQGAWTKLKVSSGEPLVGYFGTFGEALPATLSTTRVDTSTITDNPHGLGQISPCRHYKTEYGNGEVDEITLLSGIAGQANSTYQWLKSYQALPPDVSLLTLPSFGNFDLYQAQVRAWRALQPHMANEASFSGSNFLFEARELRGAPAQIMRVCYGLKAAAKTMFRQDATRTLAEIQLANSYAYQPLVKDVAGLSVILGEAGRSFARYNKQAKQWNTMHYTEQLPVTTWKVDGGSYVSYAETRGKFNASVRCKYDEIRRQAFGDFLEFYRLTLTPAQIWEMIPFSFLVDQVLTVGKSLELLNRTPVPGVRYGVFLNSFKLEAARVLCRKKTYYIRYLRGGCSSQGIDTEDDYPLSWVKTASYERFVSLPPALGGVPLPQFRKPSFGAILNDVALLRTGLGWKAKSNRTFNGPTD